MRSVVPYLFILLTINIFSCQSETKKEQKAAIKTGMWRAVIELPHGEVPFNMEVLRTNEDQLSIEIINGKERIPISNISSKTDSIIVPMHIFDADITLKSKGNKLRGIYRKYDSPEGKYELPFYATWGENYRFKPAAKESKYNIEGKWTVLFKNKDKIITSIGLFEQHNNELSGTFMTSSGDYRFLEGVVEDDELHLSTFDGTHIYLFKAKIENENQIKKGEFFSGLTGYSTWEAFRNESASLPDADSPTFLKEGYDRLSFALPNLQGKKVSPEDPKYQGKVVIVQLFGSWCPNCMDETAFLAPWYKQNKNRGVEIIALSFEKKSDFEYAKARIQKVKKQYNADYEFLFAGSMDQENRDKVLPMLNKVISFPTTIFIDKKGKVRRIHTGFTGPGTGQYYEEFIKDYNKTVDELLTE